MHLHGLACEDKSCTTRQTRELLVYSLGFFRLYDPLPFLGFIAPPGLPLAGLLRLGCLGFIIFLLIALKIPYVKIQA